eukprot:768379-Prymnesium_polylepis.1
MLRSTRTSQCARSIAHGDWPRILAHVAHSPVGSHSPVQVHNDVPVLDVTTHKAKRRALMAAQEASNSAPRPLPDANVPVHAISKHGGGAAVHFPRAAFCGEDVVFVGDNPLVGDT